MLSAHRIPDYALKLNHICHDPIVSGVSSQAPQCLPIARTPPDDLRDVVTPGGGGSGV
jgi:hypothetical protein